MDTFPHSKITDDNGNLLRLYHGSKAKFSSFDLNLASEDAHYGAGIYFTADRSYAETFTENASKGESQGVVYEAVLNIQNPYKTMQPLIYRKEFEGMDASEIRENLIARGYDGVTEIFWDGRLYDRSVVVAFYPEQVKILSPEINQEITIPFERSPNTMMYAGIELDMPKGKVTMSHSVALDMIRGESSTENMDWTDKLGSLPWSRLKDDYFQGWDNTCRLFTLLKLDYQVCNGGIAQYFFNRYHEEREPCSENDVALYAIDEQKMDFQQLVKFAREIFPERAEENNALAKAANAFDKLEFEEDCRLEETIYCDEDEYIIDDETGEEVPNPDYFEPYDDYYYEDVIHGDDDFDNIFYAANDYMEELLELKAQFYCKLFARDLEKHAAEHPGLTLAVRQILPEEAYKGVTLSDVKLPLSERIEAAAKVSAATAAEKAPARSEQER